MTETDGPNRHIPFDTFQVGPVRTKLGKNGKISEVGLIC